MRTTKRIALQPAPEALSPPGRLRDNYKEYCENLGGNPYRHVTRLRILISREGKIDYDLGIHLDRIPIEQIGPVFPLIVTKVPAAVSGESAQETNSGNGGNARHHHQGRRYRDG